MSLVATVSSPLDPCVLYDTMNASNKIKASYSWPLVGRQPYVPGTFRTAHLFSTYSFDFHNRPAGGTLEETKNMPPRSSFCTDTTQLR